MFIEVVSRMGYINAIFALALLPISLAAETCPPAKELTPCTCDREGLNCNAANSTGQVEKACKANFPYGGVSSLWIQGTPITNIYAGIFGNVVSLAFYIEMNQINTVSKEAFDPSKKNLQLLSFFGNQLNDFWYSSLKDFPRLGTLNLGRNKLTSIPANSFSHESLSTIILSQNSISSIGPNAFFNLPSLARLDLTSNSLTTLGPLSFHHERPDVPSGLAGFLSFLLLEITLIDNKISSISSTAFEGLKPAVLDLTQNNLPSLKQEAFGPLLSRMIPDGGVIDVSGNPLTCKGCDYRWIMNNRTMYHDHVLGFVCPDNTGILDLTSSSIGC